MIQARFPLIGPYPSVLSDSALAALIHDHFGTPPSSHDALQVLVTVLHHTGYLDTVLLQKVSHICAIPLPDLQALCSFYSFLDQPTPCRYRIQISTNIIDEQCGARETLAFLRSHYRHQPDIVIQATSCTGFSDLAPGALINGIPVTGFTVERARMVTDLIDNGQALAQWPPTLFNYHSTLYQKDILLNLALTPGSAIATAKPLTTDDMLTALRISGLCGRGGAGFPTWQKWSTAAAMPGPTKYVVCNADEGEPGTFKDRVLLEQHFNAVIEGMLICAHTIGAVKGLIYLRGEYVWMFDTLQSHLQDYRQRGLLANPASVGGFDIDIHVGAGAYVCGEETALLESLEGKRGIPRIRPPFPAQHGYLGAPTVVNNVETFCAVTWIVLNSAPAFAALGNESSRGTKLHSISGDCQKPGIYELPLGTTVKSLLALCEAQDTLAVQVGGPSGRMLFSEQFDTPIDFAHVSSGGSFMVFSRQRDPVNVLRNFAHFFAHESCGFCTPCRAGTQVIAHTLDDILEDTGTESARKDLGELAHLLRVTSHCGLGQTAACALIDVMHQYPERFEAGPVEASSRIFLRCKVP